MASGDEGLLTLSIGVRVSPEPAGIELLKKLGIVGGALAPLTAPQMTDVNPNRWGEPPALREPSPPGRGGGQGFIISL